MNLYHYSKEKHPVLKTRRTLGMSMPKGWTGSDDYLDHISFFFDPIPSKTIATIFGSDHGFWYRGNRIIEHIIDVDTLEPDVRYHVVESVERTKLLDEFAEENNWEEDDPKLLAKWLILERRKGLANHEIGFTLSELKKQITQNKGITELAYVAASAREDFQHGKRKYAANVPHVMIYPKEGSIPVMSFNKLTIGDNTRTPLI